MKLFPEYINKRKEDEILKLRQTIFKLNSLYQSHISKSSSTSSADISIKN